MNRQQRRDLKHKRGTFFKRMKPKVDNWTCPNCDHFYPMIFVQSKAEPYLFCFEGCEEYFDLNNVNVTDKIFPGGRPF